MHPARTASGRREHPNSVRSRPRPVNSRERFNRILDYQPVDRGFNYELGMWGQVYNRWHVEGMPHDVNIGSMIGGSEFFSVDRIGYLPLKVIQMMPPFEEEIIEEDER